MSRSPTYYFIFLVSTTIFFASLAKGADCDSSMLFRNPFGKGSANCTLPTEKKSKIQNADTAQEKNRSRLTTPTEVSKNSIEDSIGLSQDAMRDNIKLARENGYQHPYETELIKINKTMNELGDNFESKMEYIQTLPPQTRGIAATVIVDSYQYNHSGQPQAFNALIKYKDLIDPNQFRKMVSANLVDLRQLDDPNQQANLLKKAQFLVDHMEPAKNQKESSYCKSLETITDAMDLDDAKNDKAFKELENMGLRFSNQRLTLAAAAFAKEIEPPNKCGKRIQYKSKQEVFQMLQKRGYLSGREDFVVAGLKGQSQKLVPLSGDYQSCRMTEIQGEIDSQIKSIETGNRKEPISFLRTTSANCGIQITGKTLDRDKIEIRIWNSHGEKVVQLNQAFKNKNEVLNLIRGPYNQPEPQGVILAKARKMNPSSIGTLKGTR